MSTPIPTRRLFPQTDITTATNMLLDLTIRQFRDSSCTQIVEHLLTNLGCTVHQRWSHHADMGTMTWLLQNPDEHWLIYRLCVENFPLNFDDATKPFDHAWALLSTDNKVDMITDRMHDNDEVLHGHTPNDLLLSMLTMDDINQQPDILAAIDWLRDHHNLDVNEMVFLSALNGNTTYDPRVTHRSPAADAHPPLDQFGDVLTHPHPTN